MIDFVQELALFYVEDLTVVWKGLLWDGHKVGLLLYETGLVVYLELVVYVWIELFMW